MNEEKKNLIRAGLAVLCLGLLVAGLWYLFAVPDGNTEHRDRIESGFDETEREQQETARSVDAIADGLRESQNTVDRIEAGITDSQRTAENVAGELDSIETGNRGAVDAIEAAARGNEAAERAVDDASNTVRECQQLNRESESIIAKYTGGVPEK